MKYRVLPTKEILHRGRWFHAGQELELSEAEAVVFGDAIRPAGKARSSSGIKTAIEKKPTKSNSSKSKKRR